MKKRFVALAALIALTTSAFAGEAVGVVTAVDAARNAISLDNGDSYVLPAEFDMSLVGEGMTVALAYDEANGEKIVTDMEQVD